MRKTLTAQQVKKLPVGTDVYAVNDKDGSVGMMWIMKSGRKKMLKGILGVHEIKDIEGFHYEVEKQR